MADVEGQETKGGDGVEGETNNGYERQQEPLTDHVTEQRGDEEIVSESQELRQELLTGGAAGPDQGERDPDERTPWTDEQALPGRRKLKALSLYLAFLSLGMDIAVVGPSLPDLQLNTGTDINQIATLFTLLSLGYLVGSLLGGVCFEKLGNGIITLSLLGSGAMGALVPWCDNLPSLLFVLAVLGLVDGCLDSGGNAICVTLQNKNYMRTLHLVFAFGAVLSPVLASPFLVSLGGVQVQSTNGTGVSPSVSPDSTANLPAAPTVLALGFSRQPGRPSAAYETGETKRDTQQKTFSSDKTRRDVEKFNLTQASVPDQRNANATTRPWDHLQTTHALTVTYEESVTTIESARTNDESLNIEKGQAERSSSSLWIPWTIIAVYKALVAFIFFAMFCCETKPQTLPRPPVKNVEEAGSTRTKKIFLLTGLSVFYFLCQGQEGLYGAFLYSYALSSGFGFTPLFGGLLTSLFWAGFAISRATGGYCAYHLSRTAMLITNLVGLCTFSFVLAALGDSSAVPMWICTPFLGFFLAAMFPSGTAWAEQHIPLTSRATATFLVAGSLSQIILPLPAGTIFHLYDLSALADMTAAMAATAAVVYVLAQIIAECYRRRNPSQNHTRIQSNQFVCEDDNSASETF